jgi:hypothetical protein
LKERKTDVNFRVPEPFAGELEAQEVPVEPAAEEDVEATDEIGVVGVEVGLVVDPTVVVLVLDVAVVDAPVVGIH